MLSIEPQKSEQASHSDIWGKMLPTGRGKGRRIRGVFSVLEEFLLLAGPGVVEFALGQGVG